ADADPCAHRGRPHRGHGLGHHRQTAGQHGASHHAAQRVVERSRLRSAHLRFSASGVLRATGPATAALAAALVVRAARPVVVAASAALAAGSAIASGTASAAVPAVAFAALGAALLVALGLLALGVDLVEVDLAAVVDVADLDLDLVADAEDVLDAVDALAVAHLRDVQQPVAARHQRDERAEVGGLDDRAQEPVPHVRQGR